MTTTLLPDIQLRLSAVEALMRSQAEDAHPDLAAALLHLIDAGGKRVRPTITLLTGELLGAHPERLLDLAAAVEMLHTATLVHDDLIDGALLRRGMPTLNANWTPAATVLTGDFIFARAARLAAATGSVEVMDMFAEALTTIVGGEINQHFVSKGLSNREDYYNRIYAKTASMFELAAGAAALLSPHDETVREQARTFGYQIGMAFQIMDDILDFTGAQARVGKPVGSDLRNGLITLPAIYYHEDHPDDPDLISVIHRNGHKPEQLDRLIERIRASGSVEKAHAEARRFLQRGLHALSRLPDGPAQAQLAEITGYIVDRDQ